MPLFQFHHYTYRGIDLTDNTVGIAFTGVMCSDRSSVGVTQDGGRSTLSTVTTAAHELGHIFNMLHDDGEFHFLLARSCRVWL